MYQYLKEVKQLIENYLGTIPEVKSQKFYQTRLNRFFHVYMSQIHNSPRPYNTINFHDINTFINELEYSGSEKLNYYYALNGFFKYMYRIDLINTDVMKGVIKPSIIKKKKRYIINTDISLIQRFLDDSNRLIEDRLLIGLFLYTGLSRKYIAQLTHYQVSRGNEYYSIFFDFGQGESHIPLKKELVDLFQEYFDSFKTINPFQKVFSFDENYLSTKVSELSKQITGRSYTPTNYSNTFIRSALSLGNDLLTISGLTMETVETIKKHVDVIDQEMIKKQLELLDRLFKDDDIT
ncbi:hypothetical protein [Paenibacillus azoreducens]|uniref:Integrase n=1 Tax=Paenibacillus azoreducens TaxID=116718 RepID=A0A919YIK9_9BACL|nr:hypothetical protein [Paenibacillus azoreducens]GIO50028.1 hypothetical protein J34TS1_47930 [Paenibacillus azoreducens]